MRIAIVTPGFSASETDWCIPVLLDHVAWLARRHEVTVISLRYPADPGRYRVFGADVIALGGGTAGRLGRLPIWTRALTALRSRPFDVVHAIWAHEPGFLATLANVAPVVVSLFGGELVALPAVGYGSQRNPFERFSIAVALRRAGGVTAGSRWLADIASRHGIDAKVLPMGVDRDRFSPEGPVAPLSGAFPILQVGSLVPVKDQFGLIDAVRRLGDPDVHLHLVGDGPLAGLLAAAADRLGMPLTLHGDIDHGTLAAYYRAARLHVVSSRSESQNLAALEALACGTPSIGTAVGVLPEIGPTVPPANPAALAALMATERQDQPFPDRYERTTASAAFEALYRSIG